MRKTASKLVRLLDRREKVIALILLAMMIVNAFVQTVGIASIMPFLAVLGDPGMIQSNLYLAWVFERLGFESETRFLFFLGAAAFVIIVVGTGLQAVTQWVTIRFGQMRQYSLSRRLLADYLRRPFTFFVNENSADLAKTVLDETGRAINGGLMPALRLISNGLLAIAIIAFLIVIEPWLALVAAFSLGTIYGVIYLAARQWLARTGRARVEANTERFLSVGEAFAGAKEIRLLGRENAYLQRYRRAARDFARYQANASILNDLPQYAIEAIAFGGVLILTLYLLADGSGLAQVLPILGVYAMAAKKMIPAFQKIFGAIALMRFNIAAVDSVLDDLGDRAGSTPLPDPDGEKDPLLALQSIRLRDVSYSYPGAAAPALSQVNLTIPAKSTVGLVGSSGAGKSTLVDVILGLLPAQSGALEVDGVPVAGGNIRRWQAALGYVPQHIFLADDSVAGNIALGVPQHQVDFASVERAARLANLHDFVVSSLPQGYDTKIGERGVRLSGGQRQRIGIARALYRDPAVLVFDEATSALDNATERVVMEAVHNLSSQKTIILVAHRLSTVRPCDRIFVLHAGRLVEEGTWEELMGGGDHFNRLAAGMAH